MSDFVEDSDLDLSVVKRDPKVYPFLADPELNLDKGVQRRLSLHLDRVEEGNDINYMTPLGKDYGLEFVLREFDKIFESKTHLLTESLLNLEISSKESMGPRSLAKPWNERISSLQDYFDKSDLTIPEFDPRILEFKSPQLRPITLRSAIGHLKNNTNSGLPYYVKKRLVIPKLEDEFIKLLQRNDPCILFTRTQENFKTRNVWGYPIANTTNELQYFQPFLNFEKNLIWRSALRGPDHVDREISKMFLIAKGNPNLKFISMDFSSYDASVKASFQEQGFKFIKHCFQSKYENELSAINKSFSTIPILTPSGIYEGEHGIPSGDTFTNTIGSLCHYISIFKFLLSKVVISYQIQGDDGAYLVESDNVETLFDNISLYGLNVNRTKSYVSDRYLIYLQRYYSYDYMNSQGFIGGIYPVYRALNRLLFQERYSNFEDFQLAGRDYYSIRAISILENVKFHPLFEELVTFIYKLDKYNLQYSKSSKVKYNTMLNQGSGTGGFLNNQFGDDISSLDNFETVKIIRKLHNSGKSSL